MLSRQRPVGMVEQARWLFQFGPILGLATTLPGFLGDVSGWGVAVVLAAAGALVALWSLRYRMGRAPLVFDAAEVGATMLLSAIASDPMTVAVFVIFDLYFRSLYGSVARLLVFDVMMGAGLLAVRWVPAVMKDQLLPVNVVLLIATMFITTGIARYLASALFIREDGQRRLALLADLGQHLIGLTDITAIVAATRDCLRGIARATPGLVMLSVDDDGTQLVVREVQGKPLRELRTLPRRVLPADPRVTGPVSEPAVLAGVVGPRSVWVAVPPGGSSIGPWLLVGGPARVVGEVVSVLESVGVQSVLAQRTSEAHRDLTLAATCDALTGLANRKAFTTALETALGDPQRRLALMFLDLDDFKLVNDGLGHAAGDELLRQVGTRMRECVRDDDLCARLGGDEFAVLLLDADDTAFAVAQRLVERVASPVSLGGRIAQVGASVGLAFAGLDDSAEEVVQHADVAMYTAKAKGKNRVQVFDPSLLQEGGRDVFEAELAAAAGAGQLVVHYQPIMTVADGHCHAMEALVRWEHPKHGLLGPAEFIPAAERTGAIVDIGAFVLRTACADAAEWSRVHGRLAVHVNVSVAQLSDPDFEDIARRCVEEFGLEPRQLVLEITESMILDSVEIRAVLQRLVVLGVAVAIDDFGTGYAALSTLRMLPLDIVKIDKSFISGDPADVADEAIVEAVVQMAGRLGLQVIAEGVERVDQQEFLERVGVDAAQGFLHLRPTSARGFGAWLGRQAASSEARLSRVTVLRRTAR